jgi:predicted  nucleic acid-binding Zn-ribbon protein
MKQTITMVFVKVLASVIAALIIYISVSGFISLVGGTAGMVIGAIFGMAELAFILFFPSTLIKWPLMSMLGKASVVLIILSLSILSFASTNTYITKHMSQITKQADTNSNKVVILNKKIEESKEKIKRLEGEKSSLYGELQLLKNNLTDEEQNLANNMAKVREIIFYKGKNCSASRDCTDRKKAAQMIAGNTQKRIDAVNEDISMKKQQIMQIENNMAKIHSSIDGLYVEISEINQHKVEDNNAKKLYAGYEMIGNRINDIFGLDSKKPIATFTTAVAVILYAMYILLTIWMNTLLHISEDEVRQYRHSRKRKNIFLRIIQLSKAYRNRTMEREIGKLHQDMYALKKQLLEKMNELKSAKDLLSVSKQREQILLRMAKPVTETVYVAVPENMAPSEVKKKVAYGSKLND